MGALTKVLENPAVQNAGKFGIVVIAGIATFKAGQWAWGKSANARAKIAAEFIRVREEYRSKRAASTETSTEAPAEASTEAATA